MPYRYGAPLVVILICLLTSIVKVNAQDLFTNGSGFSDRQGQNGWNYAAVLYSGVGDLIKNQHLLTYDAKTDVWGCDPAGAGHLNMIKSDEQSMTEGWAWFSLRYWTAEKAYKTISIKSVLHSSASATIELYLVDARTHTTTALAGGSSDLKATPSSPEDIPLSYSLSDIQPGDRVYFALQNWGNNGTGSGVFQKWDQTITAFIDGSVANEPVWRAEAQRPVFPLHGWITKVSVDNKQTLRLATSWDRPFSGSMWIGLEQDGALYASMVQQINASSTHDIVLPLPANLPGGRIVVQCVPIDEATAESADAPFDLPRSYVGVNVRPVAWGVYRDPDLYMHPWSVSYGGLMFWDGAPFVPVGGMVNVPASWETKTADSDADGILAYSDKYETLRFDLLKSYGLRDIYFNGFSYDANPNALSGSIGIAESEGMHYGIEIGSSISADYIDLGFASNFDPIPIPPRTPSYNIKVPCSASDVGRVHHCVWALLATDGHVLDSGCGLMNVLSEGSSNKSAKKASSLLTFTAKFSSMPNVAGTLVYSPEVVMNADNPDAFYSAIDEYVSRLKQVYGTLPLGSGMRMWLDPFGNEQFAPANQLCSSTRFIKGYDMCLTAKYGSVNALKAAWRFNTASKITAFLDVAYLIPLYSNSDNIIWIDPRTGRTCLSRDTGSEGLRDLALYSGMVGEQMCCLAANTLKQIADVPVIYKHNCWFSDWFVNSEKSGGFDGNGYEAYCYGDSLAFHNSLVPLAESMASARQQWDLVTETSPAAFDGQKDYVGYLDRYQMLDDFDQLIKFGAKGIYAFGFVFDPPSSFQVTELIRDPRQLEWLADYQKMLTAASVKLASYRPEVYGWYPAYLRERDMIRPKNDGIFGPFAPDYAMSGMYLGVASQIRMAPDGRWIVPAIRPDANWRALIAANSLMTPTEKATVRRDDVRIPVHELGIVDAGRRSAPLNGFTANGIGVISSKTAGQTLDQFRRDVLGYRVFQTIDLNGQTLPDGKMMVWTCTERQSASVHLPKGASAASLAGSPDLTTSESDGSQTLVLSRQPYIKQASNLPPYLTFGYYYPDNGQPEAAILSGVSAEQLLQMNDPAWQRWLPESVKPDTVNVWKEAEDCTATTFVEPRIEGYSRYSGDTAIGINTSFPPPAGLCFYAAYRIETHSDSNSLWLRRLVQTNMDVKVLIDGRNIGVIPAQGIDAVGAMDLGVWDAGTRQNSLKVGWYRIKLARAVAGGWHDVTLLASLQKGTGTIALDTSLLGAEAAPKREKFANIGSLQTLQIDAFMLTQM